MDLAVADSLCAVRGKYGRFHLPAADQPPVETQLFGAIGGWTVSTQGTDECRWGGHLKNPRVQALRLIFPAGAHEILGKIANLGGCPSVQLCWPRARVY